MLRYSLIISRPYLIKQSILEVSLPGTGILRKFSEDFGIGIMMFNGNLKHDLQARNSRQ